MLFIDITFCRVMFFFFFFNDTSTTEIYTLSLHDALPIYVNIRTGKRDTHAPEFQQFLESVATNIQPGIGLKRSEEHTSELQSLRHLVCRLLLEKKKKKKKLIDKCIYIECNKDVKLKIVYE